MNLKEEILKEHSKEQTGAIVRWVGDSQTRFDELIQLFLEDEDPKVVQRAGWPVSYCVEQYPLLVKKHLSGIINNLDKPGLHDAVKRNTVRLLQFVVIPKKLQGKVMDICFTYIASVQEAAAVKAFSLSILDNLSTTYPEILPELKLLIEDRWDYETAAFKSRAKLILKKMKA